MDENRAGCLERMLKWHEIQYRNGDKSALLDAVDYCAAYELVMPDWVSLHFRNSYSKWKYLKVKTLNKAFELPVLTDYQFKKAIFHMEKATQIYERCIELWEQGHPMNKNEGKNGNLDGVFIVVGNEFYKDPKDIKKIFDEIAENNPTGRGLEKVRKAIGPTIRKNIKRWKKDGAYNPDWCKGLDVSHNHLRNL